MRKTSKTHKPAYSKQFTKVNTSAQDYQGTQCNSNQYSQHMNTFYRNQSNSQTNSQQLNLNANCFINNHPTTQSFYKGQNVNAMIIIPDISNSVSQHIQKSKISCQLNEISLEFNKENKRIQAILYQIRQSTEKKEKQRSLHALSQSKKSYFSNILKNSEVILRKNSIKYQGLQQRQQTRTQFNPSKTLKFDHNVINSIVRSIDFTNQYTKTFKISPQSQQQKLKLKSQKQKQSKQSKTKFQTKFQTKLKKSSTYSSVNSMIKLNKNRKNLSQLIKEQKHLLINMNINKIMA